MGRPRKLKKARLKKSDKTKRNKGKTEGKKKVPLKTPKTNKRKSKDSSKTVCKPVKKNSKYPRSKPKKISSITSKKFSLKQLESEILATVRLADEESPKPSRSSSRDMLEQILFKIPYVLDPLMGTPQQVQKELDSMAKKIQKNPDGTPVQCGIICDEQRRLYQLVKKYSKRT